MATNQENQKEEAGSVNGLFSRNEDVHNEQGLVKSLDTPRTDVGKEEQDLGSPNESDSEPQKTMGWNSKDDAGNPKNWPFGKKVFHTAIPALYGFVM